MASSPHPLRRTDLSLSWIARIRWNGSISSSSFTATRGIYKPLVRAWWEGSGFVGRCPSCHEWIRFTTLKMKAVDDEVAAHVSTPWQLAHAGSVCVRSREGGSFAVVS